MGIPGNESYAMGLASGVISFAELKVGEYNISSQAFLNVSKLEELPSWVQGTLGILAFDNTMIYQSLKDKWGEAAANELGRSFINNLFAHNKCLPNNFELQLGREVLGAGGNGSLVIAGHSLEFKNVTNGPKLPRVRPEHWSIYLDEMHVDGKRVPLNKSHVPGVPEGKVVAALDTGYTLPPLPQGAVNAIYKDISGAILYNTTVQELKGWIIPRNASKLPELSFVLGGQQYPVHPLDLFQFLGVSVVSEGGEEENAYVCAATYQASTLDPAQIPVDYVLGDSFLRSVYASFDYGDFDPTNKTEGQPFVQMVSTVDPNRAQKEYKGFLKKIKDFPTLPPSVFVTKKLSPSVTGNGTKEAYLD